MLEGIESRLEKVIDTRPDTKQTVSFLLGAIFCMKEATSKEKPLYDSLENWIQAMTNSKLPVEGEWRQNFYLNSSLQRLAAVLERGLKLLTGTETQRDLDARDLWAIAKQQNLANRRDYLELDTVRREVNRLKHDVLGLNGGRRIGLEQAEKALQQAVQILEIVAQQRRMPNRRTR
jgi:hypothetical protein